jgi:hypothetical protein
VHGWDAGAFHACVDRKGACVGIAATEGAVFGYYNPKGHVGYGESRGSIAAFLFTWKDGDTSKPPAKLRKIGKAALACLDNPESGPRMGADGIDIPLRPPRAKWNPRPDDRLARSKLGSYYERLADGPNRSTLFGATEDGKGELLRYLRVYAGVYGPNEEIPFNDVSRSPFIVHSSELQVPTVLPTTSAFCAPVKIAKTNELSTFIYSF